MCHLPWMYEVYNYIVTISIRHGSFVNQLLVIIYDYWREQNSITLITILFAFLNLRRSLYDISYQQFQSPKSRIIFLDKILNAEGF